MQERCGAHCRTTGKPCQNPPVADASRCRMHGGKSPRAQARAAQAVVAREVTKELAKLNVKPVDDPLTELTKLAGQVVAWRDVLAEKVNELSSVRYENSHGGEQLRAEVALFERALDRCLNVLNAMARLDIDNRIVEINTRIGMAQGKAVADLIRAILAGLDLTPQQQAKARVVVPRELRAMDAEADPRSRPIRGEVEAAPRVR